MVDQRSWVHVLSIISKGFVWEMDVWVLPALLQRLKGWGSACQCSDHTPHTASNWSSQKEASSKDDAQESSLLKTSRLRTWIAGTMSCGLIRLRYIYLVQMVSSVCGGNQVRSTKTIVSCLQSSMVMGVSWSLGSYSSSREPSEPILPIRRIRKLRRAPETPGGPLTLKYFFWIWIVFEFGKWLWKHKW